VSLQPEQSGYTILPSTFRAGEESPFTLTIYAKEAFQLRKL
jgi:hypothetical protein